MEQDIIFITATLRLDNLEYLAKSIKKAKLANPEFRIHWAICIDRYNAYSQPFAGGDPLSIGKVEDDKLTMLAQDIGQEYLDNNRIEGSVFFSGKPNQPNYGGDIFNGPLHFLKEQKFRDSNPLVYILDDDNLVHPLLLPTLKKILQKGIDISNKFVWLTKKSAYGFTAEAWHENAYAQILIPGTDIWKCYEVFAADPSQMIQSLDMLLNLEYREDWPYHGADPNGGMPCGFQYDTDLYLGQWWQNPSRFLFFPAWIDKNEFIHDVPCTYHNALCTNDELNRLGKPVEMHITITDANGNIRMVPVNDMQFMMECLRKDREEMYGK